MARFSPTFCASPGWLSALGGSSPRISCRTGFRRSVCPLNLHRLNGFYDTSLHGSDKGLPHHEGNWLKARLWQYGLGKRKWRSLTPPGWPQAKAQARLEAGLRRLALEPGQLTEERLFKQRVAQLHEQVNKLCRQLGAAPIPPLSGSPEVFFSRSCP